MTEFFAMGGYAAYVWPAYGFAALVLIALLVQSWRGARRRAAELEQVRRLVRPARASRPKLQPGPAAEREIAGHATEWDRFVIRGSLDDGQLLGFYLKADVLLAAVGLDRGGDPELDEDSEMAASARLVAAQAADRRVNGNRIAAVRGQQFRRCIHTR